MGRDGVETVLCNPISATGTRKTLSLRALRQLPKLDVGGSSPVARSENCRRRIAPHAPRAYVPLSKGNPVSLQLDLQFVYR
jgi:hypothetical protein